MRKLLRRFLVATSEEQFLKLIENLEVLVSKILSLLMVVVIFMTIYDLSKFILQELFLLNRGDFSHKIFEAFGLFLNTLIALEILENVTGYLKKHVLQVELVIVTSLIAVARKFIILELKGNEGMEIIGLGIAILSLSISYLIIHSNVQK